MAKGRPPQNPVIVHVASLAMARECANGFSVLAEKLAAAFWPGPLTMVLRRGRGIPDVVTAGGETVGLRWPSHPLIQAVIRAAHFPLAAPSANLSNELSPTTAAHVRKSFGARIPLIVDGGSSQVGIESTVIDLTTDPPRLLRPGMIHEESLLAVTGRLALGPGGEEGDAEKSRALEKTLFAPGQIESAFVARRIRTAIEDTFARIRPRVGPRDRAHPHSAFGPAGRGVGYSARRRGLCARALRGVARLRRGGGRVDCGGRTAQKFCMAGTAGSSHPGVAIISETIWREQCFVFATTIV